MDLIDRQAAIEGILEFMPQKPNDDASSAEQVNYSAWCCALNCAEAFVRTMPSAQPDVPDTNDGDTISRQAAIDAIVNCTNCNTADELRAYVTKHSLDNMWTGGIVDALYAVEALPSAQPHWIPVTERLPERSVEVLTYTAIVGLIEIQSLEQDGNGFLYWENQRGDRQEMTVTAWMPLPEPAKLESEQCLKSKT